MLSIYNINHIWGSSHAVLRFIWSSKDNFNSLNFHIILLWYILTKEIGNMTNRKLRLYFLNNISLTENFNSPNIKPSVPPVQYALYSFCTSLVRSNELLMIVLEFGFNIRILIRGSNYKNHRVSFVKDIFHFCLLRITFSLF